MRQGVPLRALLASASCASTAYLAAPCIMPGIAKGLNLTVPAGNRRWKSSTQSPWIAQQVPSKKHHPSRVKAASR